MLKTKSFLKPKEDSDGIRISIVGLHKWDPGVMDYTEITEIVPEMYDEWLKIFAPPLKLVGDVYIRKTCSLEQFKGRYLEYIEQPEMEIQVKQLAKRSLESTITLLCLEPTPEYCHRKYLAEQCQKYEPGLELSIE
ncbi:DUF488 family protein [Nanoarchaeota archaeon]